MHLNLNAPVVLVFKMATRIVFFKLLALQFAFASSLSGQRLSKVFVEIKVSDAALEEVFREITRQTDFRFAYNQSEIEKMNNSYSFNYAEISIEKLLHDISKQENITFLRVNKTISVKKSNSSGKRKNEYLAATGTIQGRVFDEETDEPLEGATVRLEGTNEGTVTDGEGRFTLKSVSVGTHNVIVYYLGYSTKRISNVKVAKGNVSQIEIPMGASMSKLEEVVISAEVPVEIAPIENTTEISLIESIKDTPNIVTGISNEQIVLSMDRSATDVMRRVPGVTTINDFVWIRGLDPRYNQTFLNGISLPSSEMDRRALSFDLIPTGLIDNIQVYKLPSPELPGGFGGGVIKINTKQSQRARRLIVGASAQYRTGGQMFADHYQNSRQSSKDWRASGINDRIYPAVFRDRNYIFPDKNLFPEERQQLVRKFPSIGGIERDHHNLDRRFNINYYDSWDLGEMRLNSLTSLNYTYQRTFQEVNEREQASRIGDVISDEQAKKISPQLLVRDELGNYYSRLDYIERRDSVARENVRIAALQSLTLRVNENHSFNFNLFFNRSADDDAVLSTINNATKLGGRTQYYPLIDSGSVSAKELLMQYRQRDLITSQLSGSHIFGRHELGWRLGRAMMKDQVPDFQQTEFIVAPQDTTESTFQMQLASIADGAEPRQSYFTDDQVWNVYLDYSFQLTPTTKIKAGTWQFIDDRRFESYTFLYDEDPLNQNLSTPFYMKYRNMTTPWLRADTLLAPDKIGKGMFTLNPEKGANSFIFDQDIEAYYLSVSQDFLDKKLQLNTGVRYEHEYIQFRDIDGVAIFAETTPTAFFDLEGPDLYYWLPSGMLTYNLNDQHKFRLGFGNTIDRPAFRERSNAYFYSPRFRAIMDGNSRLRTARIYNYDLRWEWYPRDGEFLSAGLFYKRVSDPIEMRESSIPGSDNLTRITWRNSFEANLIGTELEIRKRFDFLPFSWGERFSTIANLSYTHTEVREIIGGTYNFDTQQTEGGKEVVSPRPMVGSSKLIVNANLYYTQPKLKTKFSITYNWFSARLLLLGNTNVGGNLYEMPRHQLDLTLIQPIGKHLTLKVGVQDLFNQQIRQYRDSDLDGKVRTEEPLVDSERIKKAQTLEDPYADLIDLKAQSWTPGAYYSIGLKATF